MCRLPWGFGAVAGKKRHSDVLVASCGNVCVRVCVSCLLQYVVQLQWVFERRGGDADGAAVLPR